MLRVELDGYGSTVSGPGSRELVVEVTGRAPVWISRRSAWSVQETTARNVIAAAELRNYDIEIIGSRATATQHAINPTEMSTTKYQTEATTEYQDSGLW